MSNDGKLYLKARCSVCLGDGGVHCWYCDEQGMHFIEASDRALIKWFYSLTDERKYNIIKSYQKESEDDR